MAINRIPLKLLGFGIISISLTSSHSFGVTSEDHSNHGSKQVAPAAAAAPLVALAIPAASSVKLPSFEAMLKKFKSVTKDFQEAQGCRNFADTLQQTFNQAQENSVPESSYYGNSGATSTEGTEKFQPILIRQPKTGKVDVGFLDKRGNQQASRIYTHDQFKKEAEGLTAEFKKLALELLSKKAAQSSSTSQSPQQACNIYRMAEGAVCSDGIVDVNEVTELPKIIEKTVTPKGDEVCDNEGQSSKELAKDLDEKKIKRLKEILQQLADFGVSKIQGPQNEDLNLQVIKDRLAKSEPPFKPEENEILSEGKASLPAFLFAPAFAPFWNQSLRTMDSSLRQTAEGLMAKQSRKGGEKHGNRRGFYGYFRRFLEGLPPTFTRLFEFEEDSGGSNDPKDFRKLTEKLMDYVEKRYKAIQGNEEKYKNMGFNSISLSLAPLAENVKSINQTKTLIELLPVFYAYSYGVLRVQDDLKLDGFAASLQDGQAQHSVSHQSKEAGAEKCAKAAVGISILFTKLCKIFDPKKDDGLPVKSPAEREAEERRRFIENAVNTAVGINRGLPIRLPEDMVREAARKEAEAYLNSKTPKNDSPASQKTAPAPAPVPEQPSRAQGSEPIASPARSQASESSRGSDESRLKQDKGASSSDGNLRSWESDVLRDVPGLDFQEQIKNFTGRVSPDTDRILDEIRRTSGINQLEQKISDLQKQLEKEKSNPNEEGRSRSPVWRSKETESFKSKDYHLATLEDMVRRYAAENSALREKLRQKEQERENETGGEAGAPLGGASDVRRTGFGGGVPVSKASKGVEQENGKQEKEKQRQTTAETNADLALARHLNQLEDSLTKKLEENPHQTRFDPAPNSPEAKEMLELIQALVSVRKAKYKGEGDSKGERQAQEQAKEEAEKIIQNLLKEKLKARFNKWADSFVALLKSSPALSGQGEILGGFLSEKGKPLFEKFLDELHASPGYAVGRPFPDEELLVWNPDKDQKVMLAWYEIHKAEGKKLYPKVYLTGEWSTEDLRGFAKRLLQGKRFPKPDSKTKLSQLWFPDDQDSQVLWGLVLKEAVIQSFTAAKPLL